jgi:FtsZ-binding cell division protein ZapB
MLERFAWGGPDRLELAGTVTGLGQTPADTPVLVLAGAERTHRLPAATADDVPGVPENGRPWRAAFVWQEPPAPFNAAELQLGPGVAVDLPEPGAAGDVRGAVELAVRLTLPEPGAGDVAAPAVERLRFEAELLAAREGLREAQGAMQRAQEELSRARADLQAEREERAADAVRFREGLAKVRDAAEEALAAEQGATRQLGEDLSAALETLEAKDAERATLQERVETLSRERDDAEHLRAELAAARSEADDAGRRFQSARETLEAARAGAQGLVDRLAASDAASPRS